VSEDRATVDEATVDEATLAVVRSVVAEVNPTSHARLTLDSALERDLGLDSLARAELLVRVEEALRVRLGEGVLATATTARDVADAVRRAPHAAAPARVAWEARPGPSAALPTDIATLVDVLEWHATEHSDREHARLLDGEQDRLTYGQLRERADAVANGLANADIHSGDAVALMLPTSTDYFVAFMGVLTAGAIAVPIYPPVSARHLEDYLQRQVGILDNAQVKALVTTHDAARVARVVRDSVSSIQRVTTLVSITSERRTEVRPPVAPGDIALLQYTSGSTGAPKGVVLTHADLLANIRAMARAAAVSSDDVFVSWLPLYHDMGLIGAWLGSLCVGFPFLVMSPLSFLARPVRWLQSISDHAATLSAAPNFAFDLCARKIDDADLAGLDLSSWRMAFNGAEPVSAATLERFTARFAPYGLRGDALAPVYGLAEAGVGLTFPPPGRAPRIDRVERHALTHAGVATPVGPGDAGALRVVACGRPLPGYEVRIVDAVGNVLGERHEGRVEFRGPSATRGYYRNPAATSRLLDGEWLDTGDLGYTAEGDLHLTGRVKDLIIRAGRNLHPEQLEEALGRLPGARPGGAAVFAARDETTATERLVVAVETRAQDHAARDALRREIVDTTVDVLGTPPDEVVLLEPRTLPKTSSGKIRRSACRDRHERGLLTAPPHHRRLALARVATAARLREARRTVRGIGAIGYALFAWCVAVVVAVPGAVLVLLTPVRKWRFAIVRSGLHVIARTIGVHIGVSGREHLPASGAILVANHASWVDGAVLASVLPGAPVFVVGIELGDRLWSGAVLRRLGTVFVHRAAHEQGAADTRTLIAEARAGRTIVLFPEGRLSVVPGLRAFHLGAFVTAVDARVPVVPIAIRGTRSVLAPGHAFPHRGVVEVDIGEPIAVVQPGWNGALELQHAAREVIAARCGEPDVA
jgi:1-acyl-sn-glycerol-3-phosphate acyltransferase